MQLRDKFNRLKYQLTYGPFSPEPPVQKRMESLGYTYTRTVVAFPGGAVTTNDVTSPNGERIGKKFFMASLDRQFYRDYEESVRLVGNRPLIH